MAIFWIETCRGFKLMRNLNFINYAKDTNEDFSEILNGLQNEEQKKINSKFFYDDKGSRLFDKITKSSDYYPTKKELEIFEKKYQEIKTYLPPNSVVIEFGSGSNKKISKLLNIIEKPEEYISIDISKEFLLKNAKELASNFPNIKITAVCADFGDTYNLLGEVFKNIGCFEEAEKFFKHSISLAPNNEEALYNYANFLMGVGNKKDCIKILNKVLAINPQHSISYYLLSTVINLEKNQVIKNKIINFKINNFKTNEDRFNILFSKSHIYHKLKEFNKSSEVLRQANDLKLLDKPSNIKEVIKLSESIKNKAFSDKSFDKPMFKYLRDIFIVGLPRSGSTLVESIIGMNKDVHNLGENSILKNAYFESEKSHFSSMDQIYLKYSKNFSQKKFTTNKMLSNYMHIPHILSKLKHSKVIYTFRNPLDNILSMYRAKFTGLGNEYSSSLIDSAEYYIYQFKIMKLYREKYKKYIYFLSYDKLVNDPETEIRKIIDWLGFPWDASYLRPDKSQQGFFTASNVQVRSQINNQSVGGWMKYKELMKEPINLLKKNKFKLTSFENLI